MKFPADRAVTVLLYLGDDNDRHDDGPKESDEQQALEGGETAFPLAGHGPQEQARLAAGYSAALGLSGSNLQDAAGVDTAECSGLKVRPVKGDAIVYYNLRPPLPSSDEPPSVPDISTFHQSCAITQGTKWAANLWFYNHKPA